MIPAIELCLKSTAIVVLLYGVLKLADKIIKNGKTKAGHLIDSLPKK